MLLSFKSGLTEASGNFSGSSGLFAILPSFNGALVLIVIVILTMKGDFLLSFLTCVLRKCFSGFLLLCIKPVFLVSTLHLSLSVLVKTVELFSILVVVIVDLL